MPREHAAAGQVLAAPLLNDDEPLVRLAALLTIADLPPSKQAAQALAKGLCEGIARTDRWLPDALQPPRSTMLPSYWPSPRLEGRNCLARRNSQS